jgi:membrane-associated HD superfamily phosphohydrolase
MIFILFSNFSPKQVMLRPDEVANRNIVSNITAVIVDTKQTEELQKQAASKVQKVYQEDKYALANAQSEVNNFFSYVKDIMNSQDSDKETQLENLLKGNFKQNQGIQISSTASSLSKYILNSRPQDIEQMNQAALYVVETVMSSPSPIKKETLPTIYAQADNQIRGMAYASQAKEIIDIVVINSIKPNLIFNKEATDKAVKEAVEAVKPVQKTVKSGEIIVREGERVTQEQISVLEQLGIQRSKSYPLTLLGSGIFYTYYIFVNNRIFKALLPRSIQ